MAHMVRRSIAELREELRRARSQLSAPCEPLAAPEPQEAPSSVSTQSVADEGLGADGYWASRSWELEPRAQEFEEDEDAGIDVLCAAALAEAGEALDATFCDTPRRRRPCDDLPPPLGAAAGGGVAAVRRRSSSAASLTPGGQRLQLGARPRCRSGGGPRKTRGKEPQESAGSPEEEALAQARLVTKLAMGEVGKSNREISRLVDQTQARVKDLRDTQGGARARLATSHAACGRTTGFVRGLCATVSELEDGLAHVQRVRYARRADLAICERRLELLDASSSAEELASIDWVVEAVEAERQVLLQAREAFLSKEEEIRGTVVELRTAETAMRSEARSKRAACRVDQASFRHGVRDLFQGAALNPARLEQVLTKLDQDVPSTPEDSDEFFVRFVGQLRVDAGRVLRGVHAVLQWAAEACAAAGQRTRAALAKAVAARAETRRSLEAQVKQVEQAVLASEMALTRMGRWLDPATGVCADKYERTAAALQELQACRRRLQELLQRGARSSQTLEACRRVTAAAAAGSGPPAEPRSASRGAPMQSRAAPAEAAEGPRDPWQPRAEVAVGSSAARWLLAAAADRDAG